LNFTFYIAKRYLRSKSGQNAVNIINFITFLVIVIGSAALFVVLSAFSGLKTFSLQFSNTFDPDLKAIPVTGKFYGVVPQQEKALSQIGAITHFSKEIEERIYLSHDGKSHIAFIKGIDGAYRRVTDVDSTLYYGNWGVDDQQAVIGIGIASLLGLTINNFQNPLNVITLKPGKGSLTRDALNSKSFYNQLPVVVSGVYAIEEQLDKKYVFADLPLVQAFLEKDSTQVSAINFRLGKNTDIETARAAIKTILGDKVSVLSRQEQNSTLHRMLNTENLATYLIFTLVLVIALFNVVGAVIIMILDQKQNLKTLFALGATIKSLRRIYFLQGVLVTFWGGLIGLVIGSLLIGSQLAFEWLKITPSLAYPVAFHFQNVLVVLGTIAILGIISAKIASSRISKNLVSA